MKCHQRQRVNVFAKSTYGHNQHTTGICRTKTNNMRPASAELHGCAKLIIRPRNEDTFISSTFLTAKDVMCHIIQ